MQKYSTQTSFSSVFYIKLNRVQFRLGIFAIIDYSNQICKFINYGVQIIVNIKHSLGLKHLHNCSHDRGGLIGLYIQQITAPWMFIL